MLREDKVVTISDGLSGADPKPRKKNSPDLTRLANSMITDENYPILTYNTATKIVF